MSNNAQYLPLIALAQSGDQQALDLLIRKALPHFQAILRRRFRLTHDEINECAPLILWEAAKRYDATKGASYLTYASIWIRPVLRDYRRQINYSVVTVPHGVVQALCRHQRGELDLSKATRPVKDVIAREIDYKHVAHDEITLNRLTSSLGADTLTIFNELVSAFDASTEEVIQDPIRRQNFQRLLDGDTLASCGERMGLCRERVRQLRNRLAEAVAAKTG